MKNTAIGTISENRKNISIGERSRLDFIVSNLSLIAESETVYLAPACGNPAKSAISRHLCGPRRARTIRTTRSHASIGTQT